MNDMTPLSWSELVPDIAEREEAARLHQAVWEAKERRANHPLRVVAHGMDIVRCGISMIPIVDGDEIVEDPDTGEVWLRAAVGLPPRPEIDEADVEIEAVDDDEE